MPINRYQIRNVYSLADQELYKAADKDDPEALLEGVAMAGLVGVLRQLGDLAEFAAEIFHELHEEVTATAARGHGLLARAQQLELEIPSIQRSFMSQTCHSAFFTNSGVDWHPNLKTTPNLITTGDLPRFVMNSYEECRGPPRLFLLDKFDVGGAGACLKRYTDPSFYKVEVSSFEIENAETQRDKKIRKNKKKGSQWKVGGTPEISPKSKAKLHQLFMEDRMQNVTTESTHRVKLKKRPNKSPFNSETYMNKLLNSPSKGKIVHPVPFHPSIIPVPFDSPNQIFKDTIGSPFNLATPSRSPSVSSSAENTGCRIPADNLAGKLTDRKISDQKNSGSPEVNEEVKTDGVQNGYRSDDVASEMDNNVDALATIESGIQFQFSDSQLTRSTEILFHPRVPLEKTPGTSYGESIDVNQGVVLEEDDDLKNEENQRDFHSPAGSLLSFQFFGNFEGDVENEHPKDGSSPMIHPPNILETAGKINKDNHSTEDDSVSVVEETLDSCEKCSLPEEKLKEIGDDDDDVMHVFDSAEAKVSSFSEDEKELKERETGLVNSESTPDDVARNDDNALSMLEDDTKSEGREEDSVDPKMEKSVVVLLPLDVNTNENNASRDLNDEVDRNDENALPTLKDDTPLEGKGEEDYVALEEMKNSAPDLDLDDDNVDRNDDNALSTHVDDTPSFLQDQTRSFLEETNENGEKAVVLHDLGSQPMNLTEKPSMLELPPSEMEDKEDPQLLFASAGSRFSSQSDSPTHEEDPQGKPMPVSISVSVSIPDKPPSLELLQTNSHDIDHFDQVKHQFQSEEDPQGKLMTVCVSVSESVSEKLPQPTNHEIDLFDQVNHQFHSDPYSIPSQSEEDPQGKSVSEKQPQVTTHDIDLFDQVKHQFHSDPYSVKLSSQTDEDPQGKPITVSVSEKLPKLEFPQATSQDTDLFDHVNHQSPLVFPGFSMLPVTPPVKLEDTPPLPPLPPMQWRMRKLQTPMLTPTDGGQLSDNNFPPVFQPKVNEIKNLETENVKFENDGSLHAQDRDKKSASTEAKLAEVLAPKEADEMQNNIRPMKIQRPRNPLIDAVATHDKSKLRKVLAMSQITKGQENDKLLEQIRTKSYNLKPAAQTRPNIQGPTTNVRIAAILEKANAIRQAFAGSDDDDDDSDSWSDS